MIELDMEQNKSTNTLAKIKVVGIGGAGGNTVNSMIESQLKNIEFVVANTDAQALDLSKADIKIQLGVKLTKGLGAGANPEIGKRAAEEDIEKILEHTHDSDIVFLTAGMGGGTGSGATSVIAKALRENGILTIAVVTKPFIFEGKRRSNIALEAIEEVRQHVDTLIVMPNQKLLEVANVNVSMLDAFSMMNGVVTNSVKGISEIISKPGHINVDFADLKVIMKEKGLAIMGTGSASGENRAKEAANNSINSPLLEDMNIKGAKSVLINITGGKDMGIYEINEAASVIYEQADEDANIILGTVIDETLEKEISVTLIATGFEKEKAKEEQYYKSSVLEKEEKSEEYQESKEREKELQEKTENAEPKLDEKLELSEQFKTSLDTKNETYKQEEENKESTEKFEQKKESNVPAKRYDISDLDVPTFLRRQQEDVDSDF